METLYFQKDDDTYFHTILVFYIPTTTK